MGYYMSLGDQSFNYTYNVSGMWYAAIPEAGIRTHYGMQGSDAIVPLMKIYSYMVENHEDMKKFEPENGWGDFNGALTFINDLILASLSQPDEVWEGD